MAKTTRRGNGAGWGGPAKGAGRPIPAHPEFEPGNKVASNRSGKAEEKRRKIEEVKERLYALAIGAEREETQVSAARAFLDREEGLPVATNLNVTPNELERMSLDDLKRELASALSQLEGHAASEGDTASPDGKPTGDVSAVH